MPCHFGVQSEMARYLPQDFNKPMACVCGFLSVVGAFLKVSMNNCVRVCFLETRFGHLDKTSLCWFCGQRRFFLVCSRVVTVLVSPEKCCHTPISVAVVTMQNDRDHHGFAVLHSSPNKNPVFSSCGGICDAF